MKSFSFPTRGERGGLRPYTSDRPPGPRPLHLGKKAISHPKPFAAIVVPLVVKMSALMIAISGEVMELSESKVGGSTRPM